MANRPPLDQGADVVMLIFVAIIVGGGIWWAVEVVRRMITSG
jgi:hypothetical protein